MAGVFLILGIGSGVAALVYTVWLMVNYDLYVVKGTSQVATRGTMGKKEFQIRRMFHDSNDAPWVESELQQFDVLSLVFARQGRVEIAPNTPILRLIWVILIVSTLIFLLISLIELLTWSSNSDPV